MIDLTEDMVTAAAEVAEDEMIRRLGRDLGTIHRDDIIRAILTAAFALVERDQSEELALLRGLFEIQSRRMAAATAMWRSEDPVARAHTLPDLGDLLGWLMSKIDTPQLTHRDGTDG